MKYIYVTFLSVFLVSCGAAVEKQNNTSPSTNTNTPVKEESVEEFIEVIEKTPSSETQELNSIKNVESIENESTEESQSMEKDPMETDTQTKAS